MPRLPKPKVKINFTDFWHPQNEKEIRNNALFILLSKRFDLVLSDKPDFLIYSCFGHRFLKYHCPRIFYASENVRPNFRQCDYAFSFDYPVTSKNYRLPLYKLSSEKVDPNFKILKQKPQQAEKIAQENRLFCNFLYSNKNAKERIDFFHQLQQYKPIDSGGEVLNNLGYTVSRKNKKVDFLSRYKFTIAFENSSHPGYTTEKIFFAFLSGSIPIYWGNKEIAKDFNPEAFINCHNYQNFDAVIKHIVEVDNNDALYQKYLSAPVFVNNIENQYVNDTNIFQRFESIFLNPPIDNKFVAKRSDIFKFLIAKLKQPLLRIKKFLDNI